MKLYVPEIGDKLKLSSDWTFDLHWEHRNTALIKHFGEKFNCERTPRPVTLPAGTVITVDRIYIRRGASEYSSITFYAAIGGKNLRFWATLKDCNKIEFEVEKSAQNLKLFCNIQEIKHGDRVYSRLSIDRPTSEKSEGNVFKVITAQNSVSVMKVKMEAEIEWEQKEYTERNFLGLQTSRLIWEGRYQNPKYTLLTLAGEEIGSWKSLATLKKHAKEYVALHNL
jgi:hypothetical protein